mmetsp:Transcript_7863/g.18605  ORF Transcript_7863/g.18605 Transcript_7863/m.18605 type:complete len:226 (-) Transcript_7863:177-854(-)
MPPFADEPQVDAVLVGAVLQLDPALAVLLKPSSHLDALGDDAVVDAEDSGRRRAAAAVDEASGHQRCDRRPERVHVRIRAAALGRHDLAEEALGCDEQGGGRLLVVLLGAALRCPARHELLDLGRVEEALEHVGGEAPVAEREEIRAHLLGALLGELRLALGELRVLIGAELRPLGLRACSEPPRLRGLSRLLEHDDLLERSAQLLASHNSASRSRARCSSNRQF